MTFDPNLRPTLAPVDTAVRRWRPLVERADVVLASAAEATAMVGRPDQAVVADWFHARGVRIVVVKDGAAGAWASDGDTVIEVPARPVRAVDPVGAGDAFADRFHLRAARRR